jgi:hypothetical protein
MVEFTRRAGGLKTLEDKNVLSMQMEKKCASRALAQPLVAQGPQLNQAVTIYPDQF